ncbi:MAG: DNA recombination protein RmuC [Bacteroidales bacterium]|nr:DNA recombination protein RmuC [Bacteroidales bacterium]
MWIYISISFFIGAALASLYFFGQVKIKNSTVEQLNTRIADMEKEVIHRDKLLDESRIAFSNIEKKAEQKEAWFMEKQQSIEAKLMDRDQKIESLNEQKAAIEKNYLRDKIQLESQLEQLKTQLDDSKQLLKDQTEKFSRIEEQFKTEFKNMAQEILEEKTKKFTESGKKDLNEIIIPLQQKLLDFSKQVKDSYENESRERFNLKEEIKRLNEMNIKLSDQATNLATALKGDSKTQGDWGEMILENMLSDSGLTLGREYFKQEVVKDEDGRILRPDIIVKYPDNRFIIIDSKVSLRAYEAYVAATNVEEKKQFQRQHVKAVSDRIAELSSKNYQDQFEGSPDFVMMFMPIEPAFMVAVQSEPTLWNRAYEKRVILMSPTNLIAALKMISELWKHDAQNKNTIAISDAAAALYDKFVGFYADLDEISKSMDKVSTQFQSAKGKLYTGKGSLVSRVENLKKLGIKTKKELDVKLLESEMEDNDE